jgi:hypothetical protein
MPRSTSKRLELLRFLFLCLCLLGILAGCSSSPKEEPQTAKLLLHWRLDDTQGQLVSDASGNEATGTASGTTWVKDGIAYLAFPSQGGVVRLREGAELDLPTDCTLAAWVRLGTVQSTQQLVRWGDSATCRLSWYVRWGENRMAVVLEDNARKVGYLSDTGVGTSGEWHHVAITRGASEIRFFVDGQEAGIAATTIGPCESNAGLTLGGTRAADGIEAAFIGGLADFRIYDGACAPSEIAELAKQALPET